MELLIMLLTIFVLAIGTGISAGIVLQAYVPDSYRVQQRINAWARERVAAGGGPITMRIVKGANMEMERVEAWILKNTKIVKLFPHQRLSNPCPVHRGCIENNS